MILLLIKNMKSLVEEVLNLHFDEIELVVVLKSLHAGKIFWQNFGHYAPSPVRFTHGWSQGQISKMPETCFHVCQIARYVLRITKI